MTLTADKLINDDRFSGDNVLQFLLYLPFGLILLATRTVLALLLWIASIILPDKSSIRLLLSWIACCTFGVYVKTRGVREARCSVLVANSVSALDSLAAAHALCTISLRKWKLPPFFASSLGIRNAAQFVRKEHFSSSSSRGVLLQPEGGATNGRGLLAFTEWPFPLPARAQPAAISVERPFTCVTVHRSWDRAASFPWSDALWFLWTPLTVFTITLLPAVEKGDDDDAAYVERIRDSIANTLQIEKTSFTWEQITRGVGSPPRFPAAGGAAGGVGGAAGGAGGRELAALAARVKEVLPEVPTHDILRDLAQTRSVDVTITNFLEGLTPYTPEQTSPPPAPPAPRYVTPLPTGVFPKSAKERQLGFQERKAQMIAEARKRYIEKHGLNLAVNNC